MPSRSATRSLKPGGLVPVTPNPGSFIPISSGDAPAAHLRAHHALSLPGARPVLAHLLRHQVRPRVLEGLEVHPHRPRRPAMRLRPVRARQHHQVRPPDPRPLRLQPQHQHAPVLLHPDASRPRLPRQLRRIPPLRRRQVPVQHHRQPHRDAQGRGGGWRAPSLPACATASRTARRPGRSARGIRARIAGTWRTASAGGLRLKGAGRYPCRPMSPYDVQRLRADFPPLARRRGGKPPIYLNNTCMTLRPRTVIDAIARYYEEFPTCGGGRAEGAKHLHNWFMEELQAVEEGSRGEALRGCVNAASARRDRLDAEHDRGAEHRGAAGCRSSRATRSSTREREHNSNLVPWLEAERRLRAKAGDPKLAS